MRAIDAELLTTNIAQIAKNCARSDAQKALIGRILFMIENMPTIEAEPVKHGHWIRGKNKSAFPAKPSPIWYCSCCGEMIRYNDSTCVYQKKKKKVNEVNPRCRRCGARMDGDGE